MDGIPQKFDSTGFYVYSEDEKNLYVVFKSEDSVIAGLGIIAEKIFEVDSIYVDSGFNSFLYENNLNIFALGKFENLNKLRVNLKPEVALKKGFLKVFLGKNLYSPDKDSFNIIGKTHLWDGKVYPSGNFVVPGNYRVKIIAYGKNGNGYVEKEKIIKVKSKFEIDTVYVQPQEITVNDTALSKVSLFFKANMDLKADIFVINSEGNGVDTLCIDKGFYGSWNTHSIIWDAGKKPFIDSGLYRFKLLLRPLHTNFDTVLYSPNFRIINVPVIYDTLDLYIPDEYAQDTLSDKKIYDAKPEYLFSLKAKGRLTPPLPFKINVERKSAKMPLKVKWRVDYYTVDVDTQINMVRRFYPDNPIKIIGPGETWNTPSDRKLIKVVRIFGDTSLIEYNFDGKDYYFGNSREWKGAGCCYNWQPNPIRWGIFENYLFTDTINCGGYKCRKLVEAIEPAWDYLKIYDSTKIVPDTELVITDSLLGISDSGTFYIVDTGAVYKAYTSFYPAQRDS